MNYGLKPGKTVLEAENEEALINICTVQNLAGTTAAPNGKYVKEPSVLMLANKCSIEFVARLAVWLYRVAHMRDTSALLTAYVATKDANLFKLIAPKTLVNIGQIRKFVNYRRSGLFITKSLGTVSKRYIQQFLQGLTEEQIIMQDSGGNPSLADIIKLTHTRPTPELDCVFKWSLGRDASRPVRIEAFERFQTDPQATEFEGTLPAVPGRMLQASLGKMSPAQLKTYVMLLAPNELRRELVHLSKLGVFTSESMLDLAEQKLDGLKRYTTLPTSLFISIAYLRREGCVPDRLIAKLEEVASAQLENGAKAIIEKIGDKHMVVAIDCSGSMNHKIDMGNPDVSQRLSVFETACIFAYPLIQYPNVELYFIDYSLTRERGLQEVARKGATVHEFFAAARQQFRGGGTALSKVILESDAPITMMISDNESWADYDSVPNIWAARKRAKPDGQLVCWDLVPNRLVPAISSTQALNIGGLSEGIYSTIATFLDEGRSAVEQIKETVLA